MTFTALYDAKVLHPASLRDLLIRLGQSHLFRARWTEADPRRDDRELLRRRPDLDADRLARTRSMMCQAIADCLVTGYGPLIAGLELPDPNDRRDNAGRDHMTKHDGQESSFDKLENYLMSLLDKEETP